MKLLKRSLHSNVPIKSAYTIGTVYYETTLNQVIDALENNDANMWLILALKESGWDSIDFKNNMFGSKVINDKLYICQTNGQDINVSGKDVDPETALDDYELSELSAYIEPASDDIIIKNITGYEIKITNVNETAIELLQHGNSLLDVVKDAEELGLLD